MFTWSDLQYKRVPVRATSSHCDYESFRKQLLRKCSAFSKLLRFAGLDVSPYEKSSRTILQQLSETQVRNILVQFETNFELYERAKVRGQNLRDTRQLTWWAVKELGLRPPMDFFDKIEDADIVECYNEDQIQVFRSLSFFDFCSYDVLSVLIRPWHELYGRDLGLHGKAFEEMLEVLSRGESTMRFSLPPHRLWEVSSVQKREFVILHKYRGPLKKLGSSKPNGIIMTSYVEKLNQ